MRTAVVCFLGLLSVGMGAVMDARGGDSKRCCNPKDPYLWLEEVEDQKALQWVSAQNSRTLADIQGDPAYAPIEQAIREVAYATDRVAFGEYDNGTFWNFWQDKENPLGIWRRTSPEEYRKEKPSWEVLLDFDALSKAEGQTWVFKGAISPSRESKRRLVTLSPGGSDAAVVREFDLERKQFVAEGFALPEAKSDVAWLDENTVLVGTDFGPGSMTKSGYPRVVKVWKRGTPLASATTLYEGKAEDVSVSAWTSVRPEGRHSFVTRGIDFYNNESWLIENGKLGKKIPLPTSAVFLGFANGKVFARLREDFSGKTQKFGAGSVVSLSLEASGLEQAELVFAPSERETLENVTLGRDSVFVVVLENVKGRLYELKRGESGWHRERLAYPDKGTIAFESLDIFDGTMTVGYEDHLTPSSQYLQRVGETAEKIKQSPGRFDSNAFEVEQRFATSKDGTQVPYFVIKAKGLKFDGTNPTLLYGYGGFEVSLLPSYLGSTGKIWLERGGVYVVANIRGGGEYGPKWHQAALKNNRQRAYDDFIGVAEDLVSSRLTSPRKLAIMGGSNGGLLVGAVMVQRPDLFGAVVSQVPLLDMMRFDKLLAGDSWVAEYGSPSDEKMCEYLLKYSPYHNVGKAKGLPPVLFTTSTKDDRVHPGHARKMAARLAELGRRFYLYENMEGGHGGGAGLEQRIKMKALEFTFVSRALKGGE